MLLVEDSENDALLLLRELRSGGYEPLHRRVSTPEGMEEALEEAPSRGEPWQVVISDFHMPRFGALAALELLRDRGYDTPFIVVSGKIGEDAIVEMMRAGAQDYVTKEDMVRLCPTVERELREVETRRESARAAEMLRFLSEASAELSSSLDYRATLARVARLAVPQLADWCAVDVLEEGGGTRLVAVEHRDPAKVALAREMRERYPPEVGGTLANVLRTGQPEYHPEVTDEIIQAAARDAEHLRALREIGFTSTIVVPMMARGRTLGALTLVSAESGRRYGEADLGFAEELARRAALAVDNSRLYDEARREISSRKRTQEGLREFGEQLEIILRGVAEGITAQGPSGDLMYANEAAARIVGFPTAGAFIKTPVREVMRRFEIADETGRAVPLEELPGRRALRGENAEALLRFREVATGRERWAVISATPVFGDDGRVRFAVNIFRDVTESRRAEEALRQSEQLYRSVVEQAAENIFLVDTDSLRIVEANAALGRSLGYSLEELKRMSLYDIVAHDRESIDLNVGRIVTKGSHFIGERRYRRRDGTLADVEVSVSAVPYGGRLVMCVVAHDVTERNRSDEALREVREAERNRIARDLHDDILQDIVYALQEIQIVQIGAEDGGGSEIDEAAEALRRSVEGLRGAIFELRLKETLDAAFISSLRLVLDLNRRMARKRFELELVVDDAFPQTLPEKAGRELVRIVQEALANARRHAKPERVLVMLWRDGDLVGVEVTDDGRGFDVENPGVGMGQQSMRYRASELGGELRVESAPGRGTRVLFEVPLSRLVAEGSARPGSEDPPTA